MVGVMFAGWFLFFCFLGVFDVVGVLASLL
jgi:hypothetical protein